MRVVSLGSLKFGDVCLYIPDSPHVGGLCGVPQCWRVEAVTPVAVHIVVLADDGLEAQTSPTPKRLDIQVLV